MRLGKLPPLDDAQLRAAGILERYDGAPSVPGVPRSLLETIGHAGPVAAQWLDFSMSLVKDGALPAELQELVVLRVAWRLRSEYVWGGHAAIAAAAGLDVAELAAGGGSPSAEQAAVLRATDELLYSGTIAPGTWNELSPAHSPEELVELVLTVGNYRVVATLDAVFELRPEPGLPGLPPPA